jgi:hypothetical protein
MHTVYIKNLFQTTFAGGGGGCKIRSEVDGTVNSKKKNFSDFCPNYVQEFGLWFKQQSCSPEALNEGSPVLLRAVDEPGQLLGLLQRPLDARPPAQGAPRQRHRSVNI